MAVSTNKSAPKHHDFNFLGQGLNSGITFSDKSAFKLHDIITWSGFGWRYRLINQPPNIMTLAAVPGLG